MISRRKFVATMAAGAGALSLGSLAFLEKRGLTSRPLSKLNADLFRSVHPRAYRTVDDEGRSAALSLVDVQERRLPSQDPAVRVDSFSLVFESNSPATLASGIHRIDHPELGVNELFLSPVGPQSRAKFYQAVFTRIS